MSQTQLQRRRRRRQSGVPCDCLRPLIRIFGLLTAIVVCGVGVDVYMHGYIAGLFIFICSIFLIFMEIKWIVTIFLELLSNNDRDGCCMECWSICKWFGGWRLSFPYLALGIALILWPHNLWLSYLGGLLVIVLAVLRLCLICRFNNQCMDENLLPQCDFEKVETSLTSHGEEFVDISPSLEDEEPIDDMC